MGWGSPIPECFCLAKLMAGCPIARHPVFSNQKPAKCHSSRKDMVRWRSPHWKLTAGTWKSLAWKGNSSEPDLHFEIQNSWLEAKNEGLVQMISLFSNRLFFISRRSFSRVQRLVFIVNFKSTGRFPGFEVQRYLCWAQWRESGDLVCWLRMWNHKSPWHFENMFSISFDGWMWRYLKLMVGGILRYFEALNFIWWLDVEVFEVDVSYPRHPVIFSADEQGVSNHLRNA